jgi:hypothetical protein
MTRRDEMMTGKKKDEFPMGIDDFYFCLMHASIYTFEKEIAFGTSTFSDRFTWINYLPFQHPFVPLFSLL